MLAGSEVLNVATNTEPKKSLDIEMTGHAQDANRLGRRRRTNLREMTRSTVDPDCRQITQMADTFSREANWPVKFIVRNESEMTQVGGWEQIGICFNESAQHRLRHDFSSD